MFSVLQYLHSFRSHVATCSNERVKKNFVYGGISSRRFGLFTIYTGKPVGLPFGSVWANGKQIPVLGKFRLGLALTICRNPCHLPKNLHDGDG